MHSMPSESTRPRPESSSSVNLDADGNEIVYISRDDIFKGDLILVNSDNIYRFPIDLQSNLTNIAEHKNESYGVSEDSLRASSLIMDNLNSMMQNFELVSGINNIIITSAYRNEEEQQAINSVQLPRYSEHHTGLAFDVGVLDNNGSIQNYTASGEYQWIGEHCGDFGFILRYPENKADVTGNPFEPWHYRYVGTPHANYIKNNNLTLEEYLELLKGYDVNTPLSITDNHNDYLVYYHPAADYLGATFVPIPPGSEYMISGNNYDGFILTVFG